MLRRLLVPTFVLMSLTLGCGGGGGSGNDQDSKTADSRSDIAVPDAAGDDAKNPDGHVDDTLPEDQTSADHSISDADTQDAAPLDTAKPDATDCTVDADCDASAMKLTQCAKLICNQTTFVCEVGSQPDGTPCDDGDPCTGGDVCEAGSCKAGPDSACVCGDGTCVGSETCDSCAQDCGKCACCDAPHGPGCVDPVVNKCVCEQEPSCCLNEWQEVCRSIAVTTCQAACDTFCGNGICDPDESKESCELDCWWDVCGDGVCWEQETCEGCPQDCGHCVVCGDGECLAFNENCEQCPQDWGECSSSCCVAHPTSGCQDAAVMECVCASMPECCESGWQFYCVLEVYEKGCGSCEHFCGDGVCQDLWDETCSNCPADCGICAVCGDGVCDSYKPTAWETCENCADDCGQCPFCGDGECRWDENCESCSSDCGACPPACCTGKEAPGCSANLDVESCVCAEDAFCCDTQWDGQCASEALSCGLVCPNQCGSGYCEFGENCLSCSEDCGPCDETCCQGVPSAGCPDPDISACVCTSLPQCCEPEGWTFECVIVADSLGCLECGVVCGNDACEFGENCRGCPADCGECQFCEEAWYGHICCQLGDPCGWGIDDLCDCQGACDWEVDACGVNICTDGICDPLESCESCPGDCGSCSQCGDGVCTPGYEDGLGCPEDCPIITCSERCSYDSDQPCQCDDECHEYGDCCPDKVEFCGSCGDGVCDPGETCAIDCAG